MLHSVLRLSKLSLLYAAQALQINAAVRDSHWRRQRLLILCYHGISLLDEHEWSDLYISPEHLNRRLTILREEGYCLLPLKEAVIGLFQGSLPARSVVLTFDDGAHDFYIQALPLLQKHSVPATLYLTTYYCEFQRPVFDVVLSYMLWKGKGRTIDLSHATGIPERVTVTQDEQGRSMLQQRIIQQARSRRLSALDKDNLAELLSEQLGVDYADIRVRRMLHLMSPEEVGALRSPLVDVQLHTHRHRTPNNEALFRQEIEDNRAAIRRINSTANELEHFCYPSGYYSTDQVDWLRRMHIVSATTCNPQIATRLSDPLLLPRLIDTMRLPEVTFRSWLAGTASFLPQRKR